MACKYYSNFATLCAYREIYFKLDNKQGSTWQKLPGSVYNLLVCLKNTLNEKLFDECLLAYMSSGLDGFNAKWSTWGISQPEI